ncbi:MAG TPA: 6-carboxytetrahydropterin synthase [Candidatus Sulfotelmatobacter sp.]|jgi:6-pyruvoyltetrahydropterin/6-carboxytetrahydropterin synthase|nr:6-carboxytetrahydropterin synthase [Candidatus Sulfotelmatobacter sp.]
MTSFTVSRQIYIDAGHRVLTHGSKCRNLHGHRYMIEAVCEAGRLQDVGEQSDMVLDFGFLKEEMMAVIDAPCDHGFLAHVQDDQLLSMFRPDGAAADWLAQVKDTVARDGFYLTTDTRMNSKLYVLDANPTAEQLARHWYFRLKPVVAARSGGLARLAEMVVWETPNCRATFSEP